MKASNPTNPLALCLFLSLMFISFYVSSQTITKETPSVINGTVCPTSLTDYKVSIPNNFGSCNIKWTATNGAISGDDNKRTVSVVWSDIPGATATLTVKFSGCGSGNPNEGVTSNKTELILSVKNQAWNPYGSSVNVDYCTTTQVDLLVPRMLVQGTGGIAQPPLVEAAYLWTLPSGWKENGTNRIGSFGTTTNFITIQPIACAKPGNVTVYGTLAGAGPFCNSAEKSATATISLNGANPVVTVGPQPGYTGGSLCDTNPVTFFATTSVALGCISSYTWLFPPSWSLVSQTGNSITLRPSGTVADSNPIKANVNLTCGATLTSGIFTPPFTSPSLTGSSACAGGSQFILNKVPANATISWTATPSYLFATASGSFTFDPVVSNGFTLSVGNNLQSGSATVAETVATSCGMVQIPPQTVWVGLPSVNGTYNGQQMAFSYHSPIPDPTYIYNTLCSGVLATADMQIGGTSNGSWQRVSANPTNSYWSILGNNIEFSFFAVNQTAVFRHTSSNACGTLAKDYYFKSINCGGCNQFAVSPNPSSTTISIIVPNIPPPCNSVSALSSTSEGDKEVKNELTIQSVSIIGADGQNKHSQAFTNKTKKFDLDVSALTKGIYILRVSDGSYIEDHRISIQ
ncbi:MAG: T9SS type A sorting domain-containing protein [Bacteroidota bacterium]